MYKIIIAGCGVMADAWIEAALNRDDCRIVGLVDTNSEAVDRKKAKHRLSANTYQSLAAALENENASLVFDITPPEFHFNTVTTALKAGCHVFGEKPMSDVLENAEKMVVCSDETGKEFFVMQNRRYMSEIYTLKSFLEANTLGEIGQITASFQLNPHFGGFREEMNSPLIADMAIHTFDAARFITGKNPVSVYCHEFNPSWSWYKGNANAVCIFEMENGTVFDYSGSWCANGLNTSWESEWRIACENGAVFWDGADKLYYQLTDDANFNERKIRDIVPIPLPIAEQGHAACINEMFEALKNGTRPQTDCRDNIKSVRMVQNAIRSAHERKTVNF